MILNLPLIKHIAHITLVGCVFFGAGKGHSETPPQNNQTFNLNIHENSVYDALLTLAKVTQHEIIIGHDIFFGAAKSQIAGRTTLAQALQQLLHNTPYTFTINQKQIRIHTPSLPAIQLTKITVHGYLQNSVDGILHENNTLEAYPLHHLPLSIQSTTNDYIEAIEAKNTEDIVAYLNGIEYFEPSFGAHPLFYSRGIPTPFGIDGKFHRRTSILLDNAVLERIDLIQGPSMNYAEPGGLLNFVTKRPTPNSQVEWKLSAGSYDYYRGELDVNFSPADNRLFSSRLILAAEDQKHIKDFAYTKKHVVAPSLKFDFSENRSLLFSGYYQDEKEYPETLTFHENIFGVDLPRERTLGLPWAFSHSVDAYITTEYHQPNFYGGYFNVGLNWRETETSTWITNMTTPVNTQGDILPLFVYYEGVRDRFYGIDLAFEKPVTIANIDITSRIGIDYQGYLQTVPNFGFQSPNQLFNIFTPNYDIPEPPKPRQIGEYTLDGDVYGLFLSNSFVFSDSTTLYSEFRYENMAFDGVFRDELAAVDWQPSGHYKELTSQIGLNYSFNDTQSIHIAYTDSFSHQPIPNADAVLDVMNENAAFVPPIKNKQIEAAYKHLWLDGKLTGSVTAYKLVSSRIQTFSLDENLTPVNGAARNQESKGLNLNLNGRFNTHMNILANANYNDNFITTQNVSAISVYFFSAPSDENHRLRNTAKTSANLWINIKRLPGILKNFEFNIGAQYFGKRYADNQNEYELPAYSVWDAVIRYTAFEQFVVSLNIQNVTNRDYYAAGLGEALQIGDAIQIEEGEPRRIFLNIKSRFDF